MYYDDSESEEEEEEAIKTPEPPNPKIMMTEAHFLHKAGQCAKAIETYGRVLEEDPDCVDALLARSQCYMDNGQLELSLKDADAAFNGYKKATNNEFSPAAKGSDLGWKTQLQKADAMYSLGQFEEALMLYHRGHRKRPNIAHFRLGITRCKDAITNVCLTTEDPRKAAKAQTNRSSSRSSSVPLSSTPVPSWRSPSVRGAPSQASSQSSPRNGGMSRSLKTDYKHVRKLAGTQKYLTDLLQELDSSGKKRSRGLASVTRDGLRFLGARDAYWKYQMPRHVVAQLDKAAARDHDTAAAPRQKQGAGKIHDQPSLIKYIINELKRINKDFQEGRYEDCVTMSGKCLKALDMYSEEEIQNKREIQGKIHSFTGSSFLELGFLPEALSNHETDLQIAREIKNKKAESRALDNMGRVYARMDKHDDAIKAWESKIDLCTEAEERCWLFHELGYRYLDTERPEEARAYGEKAYTVAVDENNQHTQLTASTLIGQTHVVQGNLEAAHDSFTNALQLANNIDDQPAVEALLQTLDDINLKMAAKQSDDTSTPITDPNDSHVTSSASLDRPSPTAQQQSQSLKLDLAFISEDSSGERESETGSEKQNANDFDRGNQVHGSPRKDQIKTNGTHSKNTKEQEQRNKHPNKAQLSPRKSHSPEARKKKREQDLKKTETNKNTLQTSTPHKRTPQTKKGKKAMTETNSKATEDGRESKLSNTIDNGSKNQSSSSKSMSKTNVQKDEEGAYRFDKDNKNQDNQSQDNQSQDNQSHGNHSQHNQSSSSSRNTNLHRKQSRDSVKTNTSTNNRPSNPSPTKPTSHVAPKANTRATSRHVRFDSPGTKSDNHQSTTKYESPYTKKKPGGTKTIRTPRKESNAGLIVEEDIQNDSGSSIQDLSVIESGSVNDLSKIATPKPSGSDNKKRRPPQKNQQPQRLEILPPEASSTPLPGFEQHA